MYEAAEFKAHEGHRVLEIGCGTGCDLLQLAKHGADAVGIDITPEHLRLARERVGGTAEVREANATKLPFADNEFDYVYSHGVLHHIDNPRPVVEEIFRVLKPGGRLNIQVFALFSYFVVTRIIRHRRNWKRYFESGRDPVHIDLYTARKLRRLFAPAKVTVEKFCCPPAPALESLAGWFLVAKGQKPF